MKEETKEGEPASVLGKKDPDGEASRNSNCGTCRCAWMRAELSGVRGAEREMKKGHTHTVRRPQKCHRDALVWFFVQDSF